MNLDKILKNIDVKKLKYKNTNFTYEEILKKEVRRFKDILQKYIDAYYLSYTPPIYGYQRGSSGGNLRNSLSVDDIVKISANGKELTCSVLINENAIHQSYFGDHLSNAFWLINDGYSVKKDVWFKDIYRFGFYEGAHYVEDAVNEFNETDKYGITVKVERPLLWY